MGFIREVTSEVAFMANGKVVEVGPRRTDLHAPHEALTREFISKYPGNEVEYSRNASSSSRNE